MVRVTVAPDSFKGSASAVEAAKAMADGWLAVRGTDLVEQYPMADGGEGTLEALAAAHPEAQGRRLGVTGPDGRGVTARWLWLPDGTAAVELAESSGITYMGRLDPLYSTSRGLGEVLRAVAEEQPTQILVGIGGSASTDGGWGALAALGLRAFDARGRMLGPGGASLAGAVRVDTTELVPLPPVTLLADVDNPLLGERGAATVFGPQKGAGPEDVAVLDNCLSCWSRVLGGDPDMPGAGAAGGVGYGLMTVYGATRAPGADVIAQVSGLSAAIAGTNVVITGEGRFDASSLHGKVVGHVLDMVRRSADPAQLIVIAGQIDSPVERGYALTAVAGSVESAIADPLHWIRRAAADAARDYTSTAAVR